MANEDERMQLVEKARAKERSPNFPFINLSAALDRAREFYSKERRGLAPYSVAVSHWGYRESSSSGQQTVGALRAYGLIEDHGRGHDRRLRLSDSALRALLDDRPDSYERMELLQTAAKAPAVFADIYENWPDEPPSDANLRHFLLFDRNFSEDGASKVVEIFKQNEELTKVYGSIDSSHRFPSASDIIDVQPTEVLMDKSQAIAVAKTQSARIERIIAPDDVDIQVQFSGPPTLESYEFLRDYIELRIKALKAKTA
jgi:hypothetical protein